MLLNEILIMLINKAGDFRVSLPLLWKLLRKGRLSSLLLIWFSAIGIQLSGVVHVTLYVGSMIHGILCI